MRIPSRLRPLALDLWAGPVLRPVVSSVGLALATVVGMEAVFGRADFARFGPLPVPTGVPLGVIIEGAVVGILYGLVGVGIILVYRANRIISFAQAGLGGVPALVALLLVTNHHWPYWAAALLLLVLAPLTGIFVEVVLMRRFAPKPRLIATIATIGVAEFLTLGEIYIPKWLAGQSIPPANLPTPFAQFSAKIGGVIFTGDHLAVVIAGVAMVGGLAFFFQRTRLGIAVRAAAENGDRALLLGIPVARLSTIVWAIAGLLSAVAVFLRASVIGIPVAGVELSPTILLYGLAAATLGGMERMRSAMLAGMFIGVLEQASFFGTTKPDLAVALMLPLILVALLPRGRSIMRAVRADLSSMSAYQEFRPIPLELRRLPEVRVLRYGGFALLAAVFLLAPWYLGALRLGFAQLVVIYAMVGVSLVVLSGWAGQISLGQWAFAGVGAAVAGGLAANHGMDFWVTLVVAGAAGAAIAVLIGLPALRVQGLYLAVVTLAFAAFVQYVVLNREYTSWLLPDPNLPVGRPYLWQRIDVHGQQAFYYFCVAFLGLAYVVALSLRRSRSGRVFIATRDNVQAAQAYAVSSTRTRLAAFAVSGFIAAVGGALLAYQQGAVSTETFSISTNVDVFMMTILGGATSVAGGIFGAVYYIGLKYVAQTFSPFGVSLALLDRLGVATGVLLALTFFPGGIAQAGYAIRDRVLRAIAARRGIIVPSLAQDRREPAERAAAAPRVAVASGEGRVPLLTCAGVDVSYGAVQVLFDVDMEVREGEILALLGTNGAGKSTLLRAISGLAACAFHRRIAEPRRVIFDGRDVTRLSPGERARMGIVQMPGGRSIFPTLTVEEHFRLAAWLVEDQQEAVRRREEVLELFPQLRVRYQQMAGNLSGGEQQMLGLGMAFMAVPRLLMIDELSLGLAPAVVEQLLILVRRMQSEGTTVILVEQSVNVALTVAERAYFMEKGEVTFEGSTKELLKRDDVLRSVFLEGAARKGRGKGVATPANGNGHVEMGGKDGAGEVLVAARAAAEVETLPQRRPVPEIPEGVAALEARDVTVKFGGIRAVDGVSLTVAPEEILGIIGPNGAGKTTLFDALSGFVKPVAGTITLAGQDVTNWPPDDRAWARLGRSFQDARIFPSMTVAENIATALERHLPIHDHLASALCLPAVRAMEEDVAWTVADLIELTGLGAFRDKFVRELSTGSRRVVELAMIMAHSPLVLILDEPSSGIAQREVEALGKLLERIREETACAMLVIEHDMPLITAISDRMMALDLGRVIAEGSPAAVVRDARVVASYLGTDQAAVERSGSATAVLAMEGARA